MPWVRGGDTSATYPPIMRVAGLADADERSVNEVMGFVARLAFLSAAHTTDYVVDMGTAFMIGGSRTEHLIKQCKKVKLLSEVRIDGQRHVKLLEDPDFLHLRLKAELEWEAQQAADCKNPAISVPVRLRDGDLCRYCGQLVMWTGRPSPRSGTYDHLQPGEAGTIDTIVIACKSCNSGWRNVMGKDRATLSAPPAKPYYCEWTADWLTERGYPVAPSARPGTQPDNAPRATRGQQRPGTQPGNAPRTRSRQRPGSQPDTAPSAATTDEPPPKVDFPRTFDRLTDSFGTGFDRVGSGRDGEGREPPDQSQASQAPQQRTGRRKRSPRGQSRTREDSR